MTLIAKANFNANRREFSKGQLLSELDIEHIADCMSDLMLAGCIEQVAGTEPKEIVEEQAHASEEDNEENLVEEA